jgi:septal ring factor EnvC (AmiA/AmiB activator)
VQFKTGSAWLCRRPTAVVAVCLACAAFIPAFAGAANIGELQSRVDSARQQAGALASDLQQKQMQLVAAQQQAAAAAAREQQLSGMLAVGEQRAALLGNKVDSAAAHLAVEKRRLERARAALAARLVAIYKSGMPDATDLILSANGYDDLITRANYLGLIENSDQTLATRVEQVRNQVRFALGVVRDLKAKQDAYNTRLVSARAQIGAVRQQAETQASQLAAIKASREATLNTLQSNIGSWVGEIQQQQAINAQQAQAEVGQWLGGPYSIPASIVMCESGGNYGAVNPSSGAGGAYQILPSTWHLYGASGSPQNGSKQQQDQIASQIWSDSGSGAWVCAG